MKILSLPSCKTVFLYTQRRGGLLQLGQTGSDSCPGSLCMCVSCWQSVAWKWKQDNNCLHRGCSQTSHGVMLPQLALCPLLLCYCKKWQAGAIFFSIRREGCKTAAMFWRENSIAVYGKKKQTLNLNNISKAFHKMAWVEGELKDHLIPSSLLKATPDQDDICSLNLWLLFRNTHSAHCFTDSKW